MALRDSKKDEESASYNPFVGLEKSAVLQEARSFNDMPIKVRKCSQILTKILFIIYQGDSIGTREATETFFAMTKLFQVKDMALRRMVYLCIKAMSTISEDVIMVTASLMKDINGPDDQCKGSAIRALCTITDSSMLQSIERYLKQGLVDKNSAMQSASLVSALHLLHDNQDVVKRWVNEVTQALNSRSQMAQYHALGLLYQIKSRDRLAVQKLVADQIKSSSLKSPFAYCLLIRFASKVMEQDPDNNSGMFEFLESCLRNKSEMVIYEAARAIVNIKNVTARDLAPAVSVLQLFLSSPRATLRFAAVRTLNKVAMTHPQALKTCNLDMEQLISDSNRSVATLAITTLLKTGTEASVDRLMKSISSFMHEISDEFKIVVIEAIRSLCIKFPKKHNVLMGFLAGVLRDEGGLAYKSAIVDTIINIVENVPEAKEAGLGHLCEFIEDCEFPNLLSRTLHLIGDHGPRTPVPSKYIRFIYNRLILEDSVVRAAAVSALAKFGAECPPLRPSILVLLRRALHDGDDEVRDRVTLYISLLESNNTGLLVNPRSVSVTALERSLNDYLSHNTEKPFDIKTVPVEAAPVRRIDPEVADFVAAAADTPAAAAEVKSSAASKTNQDIYAAQLASVPELEGLGPLFRSSKPTMLTESETEYVVQLVKHIFQEHIVFQFTVTNTLNDQVLEKVKVSLEGGEQEVDPSDVITVPIPSLKCDQPGETYVCLPLDCSIASQTFSAKLDFIVKDCDPETGECDEEGYPDTYLLEDFEVNLADYMQPVDKPNFGAAWESLEGAFEQEQTFALSSMSSLEEAVNKIMEYLGMGACEKSNKVKEGKNTHTLFLAGVYVGGHEVLARAKLVFDQGVNMDLAVRCSNETICELVANAIG